MVVWKHKPAEETAKLEKDTFYKTVDVAFLRQDIWIIFVDFNSQVGFDKCQNTLGANIGMAHYPVAMQFRTRTTTTSNAL